MPALLQGIGGGERGVCPHGASAHCLSFPHVLFLCSGLTNVLTAAMQVADFALQVAPLGHLQQLTLSTDGPSWHCEMVVVEDTHLGEAWFFLCDR